MDTGYLSKLQKNYPDVARRYQEKLEIINGVDPYTLSDERYSFKAVDFPDVTSMDIVSYLVLTNSYYTKEQMKAFKSLEAFKYFEAGFVSNCSCCTINNIYVVRANVKHSQRMNDPSLKVWIYVQGDGGIQTGHCTCMAGISEVCSHIAAVLYALEFIATERKSTSCTDVRAMWKVPSVSKVEYEPLRSMPLGRIIPGSSISNVPPLDGDELIQFFHAIEEAGGSSALTRILEPWASTAENVLNVKNPFIELFNEMYLGSQLNVLQQISNTLQIFVSSSDCALIQNTTKNQSKSIEWFNQRAGRITASKIKAVCSTTITKPSLSLIKCLCYPRRMQFKSKATEWGLQHEKMAIKKYEEISTLEHEGFESSKCGLFILEEDPEFAATPDAIIRCMCCGKGCLEVKCPYLLKNTSILEFAGLRRSCLVVNDDGKVTLDRSHAYYYQVQMQMAITRSKYCEFFVWSPKDYFLERIFFEEGFWDNMKNKARIFHKSVILPELLGRHFTEKNTSDTWCVCKGTDDGRPMIKCENDLCKIGWYHLQCIGFEEVPDFWFLCDGCQL